VDNWPVLTALAVSVLGLAAADVPPMHSLQPPDTGAVLVNPGMGWVLHYYDNVPANYGSRLAPSDTVEDFPGLSTVYLRIPWSYVEPEEGAFNWSVVDTPAQRWIARGKRIAFRFSCSESWLRYATPRWVQEAGAAGHGFEPGKGAIQGGPLWEPDFEDPVFLDRLDRFLAAAAARYDGDPTVDFIDVGSFGVWGEGHTFHSSQLAYSAETIIRHIDLHTKHFSRTLLAANDDFRLQDRGPGAVDHAREHGLTLRDDSILVQGGEHAYFSAEQAQGFWPTVPVILESEHYGGSRDRGNWRDGAGYLEAVERYHASYVSIHWWPREFLAENEELVARINRRLGYRLQLAQASWTARVDLRDTLTWRASWRNAGVAPCYLGGTPCLTLKDPDDGIVAVFADESFNVRDLPVGEPGADLSVSQEVQFRLPFQLRGGTYRLFVSVGTRQGTPTIALPLPGDDGQRRYLLGEVAVTGDYDLRVGVLSQRGEQWLLPVTYTVHRELPEGSRPFCHFDEAGHIAFQGVPEADSDLDALRLPGETTIPCVFTVPAEARGKSFQVAIGLWVPERVGEPDERLIPDRGGQDRRQPVGRLVVDEDGAARLEADAG